VFRTTGLERRIAERARELGFVAIGFVPAGPVSHAPHLETWLKDGFAASMDWMHGHQELRTDTRLLHPGARTVITVAAGYDGRTGRDPGQGHLARYAVGLDYHDVMRAMLRRLGEFIRVESGVEVDYRPTVDSAPVLERNLAVDGGLGWLGKSAMVLNRTHGTWMLLGELFVDLDLEPQAAAHADFCGRCTACIDACPTGAIVGPYRVDARRCISYLTIEHRGPIPRGLRSAIGLHLFGCDICQDVCPWNNKAGTDVLAGLEPLPGVVATGVREVLRMTPQEFNARFRGTPILRTRRRGLVRNACVVAGNLGLADDVGLLAEVMREHDEPLARGHAAWALGRIGGASARSALERGLACESDEYVREEIRGALE